MRQTLEQRVLERTTELRELNAQLERRVIERTAALEKSNHEFESFTYSVAHDLKSPLRGIDGYSSLMLEEYDCMLDETAKAYMRNIRWGTQQMGHLITDLLEYTRLERRELNPQLLNPQYLIESILIEREHEIAMRNIQVQVEMNNEPVRTDAESLQQVMRHLLDNAFKFSRNQIKPSIKIESFEDGSSWVLAITDNGIGFDMRYHDQIFGVFQRLDRAEDYPGTGIGLALAGRSIRLLGGAVWATSTPGRGSTFFLALDRYEKPVEQFNTDHNDGQKWPIAATARGSSVQSN